MQLSFIEVPVPNSISGVPVMELDVSRFSFQNPKIRLGIRSQNPPAKFPYSNSGRQITVLRRI